MKDICCGIYSKKNRETMLFYVWKVPTWGDTNYVKKGVIQCGNNDKLYNSQ
jgi:hypothetical protein